MTRRGRRGRELGKRDLRDQITTGYIGGSFRYTIYSGRGSTCAPTFLRPPPRSFPPFCTPCRELSTPDLFKLRALHGNALNRDPGGGCLRDGYRFCHERERKRDPVFREWMCNNSSLRLQGKITGKI